MVILMINRQIDLPKKIFIYWIAFSTLLIFPSIKLKTYEQALMLKKYI